MVQYSTEYTPLFIDFVEELLRKGIDTTLFDRKT